MISDAYQFIFIHINKTGGTSIEKVFERSADQRDVALKHASVSEIQAQYPQAFASYFKFTFVRNPWDWLVSRYHWSRDRQGLFDYSFTEFLERLASGQALSAQAPWLQQALAPQVSRLKLNGQLAVDFIGRFENLQEDFNQVCQRLGLVPVPLPHVFRSEHKHYAHYYTEQTRELVAALYAEDIALMNYYFETEPPSRPLWQAPQPAPESDPVNIIRTFWHGSPLGPYEELCLRSYVKQGHRVQVFTYGTVRAIPGVEWRDAAEILPESEVFSYRSGPGKGSLAGFANLFRYRLLSLLGGTWSDLDVFCLKPLHTLPAPCVGLEAPQRANNALLRFPPGHPLMQELYARARQKGQDISWGETGPDLLTAVLPAWQSEVSILPPEAFYPIPWQNAWQLQLIKLKQYCQQAVEGAYCLHWWNEIFRRIGLPRHKLPPAGSFLHALAEQVLTMEDFPVASAAETEALIWAWGQQQRAAAPVQPAVQRSASPPEQPLRRRLIISPTLLPGGAGQNICGPSLIRVPAWVKNPLGQYYLYFAQHKGRSIHLAYADQLTGPWQIHRPGCLQLEQTPCLQQDWPQEAAHIASPDVHVDEERQQICLYFHGIPAEAAIPAAGEKLPQHTWLALSENGLDFVVQPEILGGPYFRVFQYQGQHYALAQPGRFYRSETGREPFTPGPQAFDRRFRHGAVLVQGDTLLVLFSRLGDAPECLLLSTVDLSQPFACWQGSEAIEVLRPQTSWEGAHLPILPSSPGPAPGPVHQLRDPAFFLEQGRLYVLYSVAGEQGIALTEVQLA